MTRSFTFNFLVSLGCLVFGHWIHAGNPPNILFIIADDLGWADVGYHGSEINTPNLDTLARASVILDQHYVTPMCSSTRACLLSGRYSTRYGLDSATNNPVYPSGTETLASALKSVGYETCITGKWHLGSKSEWGPLQSGFTRSHGSLAGGVDQYSHLYKKGPYQKTWHRDDVLITEEGHATDLFASQAIEWIEEFGKASDPPPWYVQVAFTAVHVPIQEPDEWVQPYEGRIGNESRKRFAACASHMDDAIGQVVQSLERSGQRENTLIIFTSDNGGSGPWEPQGLYPGTYLPSPVLGNNLPLRGRKGTVYEGGIRVPAFVNWPGTLNPGKLIHPIHMVDWMPTLLNLCHYETSEDLLFDGMDVWPLVTGKEQHPESRILYFKRGNNFAIREGSMKLVQSEPETVELFDLQADPYEEKDLSKDKAYLVQVEKLSGILEEQRSLDKAGLFLELN